MKRIIVAAMYGLLLQGCSIFTRPMEKPVIEDSIRSDMFGKASVGVLTLTPERRIVLYSFKTERFCAENPTEVGIDMASAAKIVAAAKVSGKADADVGIAIAAASNNYVLNRRTQGMQLYQSASYTLCQLYMNGEIDAVQLGKYQMTIFKLSADLISTELRTRTQSEPEPHKAEPATSSAAAKEANVEGKLPAKAASSAAPAASASSK